MRKIFASLALVVMLLLSFAFSPPDASARDVPQVEKQTSKHSPTRIDVNVYAAENQTRDVSVYQMTGRNQLTVPNDALIQNEFSFDASIKASRIPEIIPTRTNFKLNETYISRCRNSKTKPPKQSQAMVAPEIVMLR